LRLRFRDFLFDVGTRSLTRGDRPVPLSPKAFRLLEVLVLRRPDAVSHDELRRTLWSDAADGGTTLARLVSEIRTALDDHDDAQPIVRTVHRFGYAFAEATAEEARTTPPVGRYAIRWGSQLVPLADGENLVGRGLDGVIAIPSSKASRRHARIVVSSGNAVIEDLGSRNGTKVNDAVIEGPVELKNGDRIRVGPAVLVFCVAGSSAVTSEESGPLLESAD
jgi:DNA-binding winged helix-turn-helix (wHTH) protein